MYAPSTVFKSGSWELCMSKGSAGCGAKGMGDIVPTQETLESRDGTLGLKVYADNGKLYVYATPIFKPDWQEIYLETTEAEFPAAKEVLTSLDFE